MRVFIPLVIFVLLSVQILGQDYYKADELDINLTIANSFTIVPKSSDYSIKNINVALSFVPAEDARQDVISLRTEPQARRDADQLVFTWENPDFTKADYFLESRVRTRDHLVRIEQKQRFPIVPDGMVQFLDETDNVDFRDPEIQELAQSLAEGEDDLYVVTHKFAEWVNENIKYDLNTITADASQKASWVLDNRIGVCDELTNLFIGLCRSVGIPAKFVSGIAYTTDERFAEPWTSHGWAEVYFPDYGWVPFDVTYGEFGYIDPAHIKLKEAEDADKSGTRYEWEARNADVRAGGLVMHADIISAGDAISPLLSVNSNVVHEMVAPGSYNILEVNIKNSNSYYVPTEIRLSRTEELEMLDPYEKSVLLKPGSETTLLYRFRIDESLKRNFIYTFKIDAETSRGAQSEATFQSMHGAAILDLDDVDSYVKSRREEETKVYSKDITFNCSSGKDAYYMGETAGISCVMRNTGNTALTGLIACLEDDCHDESLGISESKIIVFDYLIDDLLKKPLITVKGRDVQKTSQLVLNVYEKPDILIANITAPKMPGYSDDFTVSFFVDRPNDAPLESIVVSMTGAGIDKRWVVDDLGDGQAFSLKIAKHSLPAVENKLVASVDYSDTLGRKYHSEQEIDVQFAPLTLKERAIMLANAGGAWILQHVLLSVLIAGGIVFGLALASIFRRRG